jgi:hypothetical protein
VAATIENFVSPCRNDSLLRAENPCYLQLLLLVELQPPVAGESCFALKGGTGAISLYASGSYR